MENFIPMSPCGSGIVVKSDHSFTKTCVRCVRRALVGVVDVQRCKFPPLAAEKSAEDVVPSNLILRSNCSSDWLSQMRCIRGGKSGKNTASGDSDQCSMPSTMQCHNGWGSFFCQNFLTALAPPWKTALVDWTAHEVVLVFVCVIAAWAIPMFRYACDDQCTLKGARVS